MSPSILVDAESSTAPLHFVNTWGAPHSPPASRHRAGARRKCSHPSRDPPGQTYIKTNLGKIHSRTAAEMLLDLKPFGGLPRTPSGHRKEEKKNSLSNALFNAITLINVPLLFLGNLLVFRLYHSICLFLSLCPVGVIKSDIFRPSSICLSLAILIVQSQLFFGL